MGNNRLHAVILMYIHKNILHKINSADAANEFVDRKGSCKQTFRHFSNICKIHSICTGAFQIFIFPIKCIKHGTV